MKKARNVIIACAVPEQIKIKFERICTMHGTDVSKMIRSFIEISNAHRNLHPVNLN